MEYSPDHPLLYYKLGLAYYADHQYKKAIKSLKSALINSPESSIEADIYYHIGLSYCRLEQYEKAIYPLTKTIDLEPANIRFLHERAKAYQMVGDHESAVQDFSSVIKNNPKNAHAHFRRAFSYKELKQYAEGVNDFEQAKLLDPLNPKMIVNYKKIKGISCIVLCKPGEEKLF